MREFEKILNKHKKAFAFVYEDMPGVDPKIVEHCIPTYPRIKSVKQKLRRLRPEWADMVKVEVEKQIAAKFLDNVVPVPKKDGRVRMCVDYRDLNKACPKDDFPLPHIDVLVDNAACSAMYSFMDGFSGYNQVLIHPNDQHKTAFATEWGTFAFRRMPFGLTNAPATFQRLMCHIFKEFLRLFLEVYVDDLCVHSKQRGDHLDQLKKIFKNVDSIG